jgi:hypothetical protein
MDTPLHEVSYAVIHGVAYLAERGEFSTDVWRDDLRHRALSLADHLEHTVTAGSGDVFARQLLELIARLRALRTVLRLLDDLDHVDPEQALQLHGVVDESLRVAYAAYRTAKGR